MCRGSWCSQQKLAAAKKTIVSLHVGRLGVGQPRLFGRAERDFERVDNSARDVVLDRKDIRQIAVVAVGPEVRAGRGVDELRGNPTRLPARRIEPSSTERTPRSRPTARTSTERPLKVKLELRAITSQAGDLRQVGDDVFADAVGEVLLLRVARHVGERQNGNRRSSDVRLRFGSIGSGGGRGCRARVPFPDSDWPVNILDADVAAILEANVDPIADAFVDDRGDADSTGLGERLQSRGDVDAIAINVLAFDNDVAKIDADSQHDDPLRRAFIRRRGTAALHRKRAVYGIDHAAELDDGAIADQLHDAAVVGGDGWVEDGLSVPLQSSQSARLVGSHQSRIADHIGREDRRQFAVNAHVGHEESVPEMSGILSAGDVDRHAAPNHFVQQDGELGLGLGHQVGNGLKWDPPQEAER